MGRVKVSVIIPMFNSERTIERCIKSVERQSLKEIEIIAIDDGSQDKSRNIIENFRRNYNNIILLVQKHQGAGNARNYGIRNARGDFVAFLDSDDEFVDPDALERMIVACESHCADICGSNRLVIENGVERKVNLFAEINIPAKGRFVEFKDFQHDYDYQSFIFRRRFLVEKNICFPNFIRYQDPPFFLEALSRAERFYLLPVNLYRYYFDPVKEKIITKHIESILQAIKLELEICNEKRYDKLYKKILERIDVQFHDAVIHGFSEQVMYSLLEINEKSRLIYNKELKVLEDIYALVKNTQKIARSNDLMRKIVLIKQRKGGFTLFFKNNRISDVAVYGLGEYGKILLNELKECEVNVVCCIDKKEKVYEGMKVIKPDDTIPSCDVLIISLLDSEEIVRYYRDRCRMRIITFAEIIDTTFLQLY